MRIEAGDHSPAFFLNSPMNWTKLSRTAAPTEPVVTLDDVKQHLAIAHSDEDTFLSVLIDVATESLDGPNGIGVALLTQSWRMSLDNLSRVITLPLGPVQSVDIVTFEGQTIDPESYTVDLDQNPAKIFVNIPRCGTRPGCVKVNFTAGFGDSGDDVPADLRHVIRMLVGTLYANRESTTTLALSDLQAVKTILDCYRS